MTIDLDKHTLHASASLNCTGLEWWSRQFVHYCKPVFSKRCQQPLGIIACMLRSALPPADGNLNAESMCMLLASYSFPQICICTHSQPKECKC